MKAVVMVAIKQIYAKKDTDLIERVVEFIQDERAIEEVCYPVGKSTDDFENDGVDPYSAMYMPQDRLEIPEACDSQTS